MGDFLNTVFWRVLPHPDSYGLLIQHLDGLIRDLFLKHPVAINEQACRLLRFYFMLPNTESSDDNIFENSIYKTKNFGPDRPEFLLGLFLGSSLLTSLSVNDIHACLAQSAINRLLDHPELLSQYPILQVVINESGLQYANTLAGIQSIEAYARFITALLLLDTENGGLDVSHFINPSPAEAVSNHLKLLVYAPDYEHFNLAVVNKPQWGHIDCAKLIRTYLERKSIMELWANNGRFIGMMLNRTFVVGSFAHELPQYQTSGPVGLYIFTLTGAIFITSVMLASFYV